MVVSHSRALAEAAVALAREVLTGRDVPLEVAAGLDDGAFGTDATAIAAALEAADRGAGVVVLMDLGSAVLSAELALELVDEDVRAQVVLCPAPLVEGLVGAAVAAGGGAARDAVAAEALAGLAGKQAHLEAADAAPAGQVHRAADPATHEATVVVADPHGLHARPAARLVQRALTADADVELRNATTGSPWVPATSLSRVATLGVLHGHELGLRASGPDARATVDALVAVAADPGNPGGAAPSADLPQGAVGASPGVAVGPARVLRPQPLDVPAQPAGPPEDEWAGLTAAREAVRAALRQTRQQAAAQVGEREAALFDAHLLLLDDADLLDDARAQVDAGRSAGAAWAGAVASVRDRFAALSDPYLQGRAADVDAVGRLVLESLLGAPAEAQPAAATGVLLARDLTPAQAVALDPTRVAGVVLAEGSPTSHSAILVRARGLPAVVAAGQAVLATPDGTRVALDGTTGELVVDPDDAVLRRLSERADQQAAARRSAAALSAQGARTRDGVEVLVGANVGSADDARLAAAGGADLAGLVRTEFLFLGRTRAPDVDEQEAAYREVAHALGGRRVVLRTLDVGGDKPLPYLPVAAEANPFLGVRGLRLSLARPGLLADQLLAVVRVAHDAPTTVLFPMVSTLVELRAARTALDDAVARDGRGRPAGLEVGVMVEVPAAALKTPVLAPLVDLLSIGTNDLTQYALAAERGNAGVARLADPYDPGVLRLVQAVCAGAGDALVAVCGEVAADEAAAELLVGLGVRELSVAPAAVAGVKQAVRRLDAGAARRTAERALTAAGPDEVRALLGDGTG